MSKSNRYQKMTVEEYLEFERNSETKHEYVDGYVIPLHEPWTPDRSHISIDTHHIISGNVFALLHTQLHESDCKAYHYGMQVNSPTDGKALSPDVTIVCGEREFVEDETEAILINPIAIIEVTSESTELDDRADKFYEYQRIPSLQDYVIVTDYQPYIELYSRQEEDWLYKTVKQPTDILVIPSIDVTLTLSDVYVSVAFDE